MSNPQITKTVLYAVPTDWMGDEMDPDEAGISTYVGPRYLQTVWDPSSSGLDSNDRIAEVGTIDADVPIPPGFVEVTLDAEQYPLHAMALWGWQDPAEQYEVECGPSNDPNPTICDPYHFSEAFDLRSFYYDTAANSWSTPLFSHDEPSEVVSTDTVCFGWDQIRNTRNRMLDACDARVAAVDMPTAVKQPWLDYRTKLRNLPTDWAGVGTATHLIVWPLDPDQLGLGVTTGERPNNGITG